MCSSNLNLIILNVSYLKNKIMIGSAYKIVNLINEPKSVRTLLCKICTIYFRSLEYYNTLIFTNFKC